MSTLIYYFKKRKQSAASSILGLVVLGYFNKGSVTGCKYEMCSLDSRSPSNCSLSDA